MTMMINLLPDLRQAKLREHQRRQLATGISISIWVVCGAVVALMAVYAGGQKVIIAGHTKNIANKEAQLTAIDGLVPALTASQHLAALPGLYDKRVYITKFFTVYNAAMPASTSLSSLEVDASNVLTVRGSTDSYASVAKLARALAASNIKVGANAAAGNVPYFTDVTIVSVANEERTGVSFSITATVDPGVTNGNK